MKAIYVKEEDFERANALLSAGNVETGFVLSDAVNRVLMIAEAVSSNDAIHRLDRDAVLSHAVSVARPFSIQIR